MCQVAREAALPVDTVACTKVLCWGWQGWAAAPRRRTFCALLGGHDRQAVKVLSKVVIHWHTPASTVWGGWRAQQSGQGPPDRSIAGSNLTGDQRRDFSAGHASAAHAWPLRRGPRPRRPLAAQQRAAERRERAGRAGRGPAGEAGRAMTGE